MCKQGTQTATLSPEEKKNSYEWRRNTTHRSVATVGQASYMFLLELDHERLCRKDFRGVAVSSFRL